MVAPLTKTTYTPFPSVEEEVAGSTTTRRVTYNIAGQAIALRVQIVNGTNTLYYLHNDHLGSTRLMTYDTGTAVPGSTTRYYPFGDWRTEPTTNLTDRGYTGHQHNNLGPTDLGLIYMNARYYIPAIARFISADTLIPNSSNPQSYNRYSYVQNRPILLLDPTGHISCTDSNLPGDDQLACQMSETVTTSIQPQLQLQDWELQLIAMVAYFETTSAPEQRNLVIWTILNRLSSPAFSNSVEELLVGTQYHVSLRNPNAQGVYQNGVFAPYKDPNRVGILSGQALSDAAFAYYSQGQPLLNDALIDVQMPSSDGICG